MTQDPSAKARELYRRLHGHMVTPTLEQDDVELLTAALTEARADALEEAAKVAEYWCDEGYHGEHCANDCSAARIRALKEKA